MNTKTTEAALPLWPKGRGLRAEDLMKRLFLIAAAIAMPVMLAGCIPPPGGYYHDDYYYGNSNGYYEHGSRYGNRYGHRLPPPPRGYRHVPPPVHYVAPPPSRGVRHVPPPIRGGKDWRRHDGRKGGKDGRHGRHGHGGKNHRRHS